jgi:hypothetical protein
MSRYDPPSHRSPHHPYHEKDDRIPHVARVAPFSYYVADDRGQPVINRSRSPIIFGSGVAAHKGQRFPMGIAQVFPLSQRQNCSLMGALGGHRQLAPRNIHPADGADHGPSDHRRSAHRAEHHGSRAHRNLCAVHRGLTFCVSFLVRWGFIAIAPCSSRWSYEISFFRHDGKGDDPDRHMTTVCTGIDFLIRRCKQAAVHLG